MPDRPDHAEGRALRACRGFDVLASDGPVGTVERVLLPPGRLDPDYLVVRTGRRLRRRFPVVTASFVRDVDARRRVVYVSGWASEIASLPEELPLAV
jgi:hypothetical protein